MDVIQSTELFVKDVLKGDSSGHDWWHVHRVRNLALRIAKEEKADPFIVELAALLHDVDDFKLGGDGTPKKARQWLESQGIDADIIDRVCVIIENVSFKGASVQSKMESIEGRCVQDADRLDAIGAIGVARTFMFSGSKGRMMHDPDSKPVLHSDYQQYKNDKGTTINHFHEKLLLLKDRMNTATGKRLAEGRHNYMELFLREFHDEWDGKK
jgi:uncharacterized protein